LRWPTCSPVFLHDALPISRVRRPNGRAGRAQEIGAAMSVSPLAVEDAARAEGAVRLLRNRPHERLVPQALAGRRFPHAVEQLGLDRKSTRLNSSHEWSSYA